MGRIGRPGNKTSVMPVAIYLGQTSSEAHYIKKLIFTKRVPMSTHLADADVDTHESPSFRLQQHFKLLFRQSKVYAAGQHALSF